MNKEFEAKVKEFVEFINQNEQEIRNNKETLFVGYTDGNMIKEFSFAGSMDHFLATVAVIIKQFDIQDKKRKREKEIN